MAHEKLVLTLGKVIAAAAWADGAITPEEINCLKDLAFRYWAYFPAGRHAENRQWAMLEMYLESPVGAEERARLVDELQAALWTWEDREVALAAVEAMMQADGPMTEAEEAVFKEITEAIEAMRPALIGQVARLVRGALDRRARAVDHAPNRDRYFDAYQSNRVYYAVLRRLNRREDELRLPPEEMRRLCLAGGLLARVARADQQVTDGEVSAMTRLLAAGWEVEPEEAALVAEAALDETSRHLDTLRLTRDFFTCTTVEDRVRLIEVLFMVAAADGRVTADEIEEIRHFNELLALNDSVFQRARARFSGGRS